MNMNDRVQCDCCTYWRFVEDMITDSQGRNWCGPCWQQCEVTRPIRWQRLHEYTIQEWP